MNDDELRQVEAQLREVFQQFRLDWVLDQVDTSVAEGLVEELPHFSPRDLGDRRERMASTGSTRSKPAVTNRPLATRERIEFMIDALFRILVDIPAINSASWANLSTGFEGRLPTVETLSFVPDEDSFVQASTDIIHGRTDSPERLDDLREVLNRLRDEVR